MKMDNIDLLSFIKTLDKKEREYLKEVLNGSLAITFEDDERTEIYELKLAIEKTLGCFRKLCCFG